MSCAEKVRYWKKHVKQLSHNACETAKDVAVMLFDTKSYNDNFLQENGEPTMDEYSEIMRKHDLIEEKNRGYYFGDISDIIAKENER